MFTNNPKASRFKKSVICNVEIDELSKVPKYRQVSDHIISCIAKGNMNVGDKVPSINETSEELLLSRDTVEKAFKDLSRRGIITAVRGKGFYVATTQRNDKKRVLLVLNKLSDHKKAIYTSFVTTLGQRYNVELQIHDSESTRLEKIVIEGLGKYDYYVIMPLVQHETESMRAAINKIPKDKLFLLNKDLQGIRSGYGCVYEDFELDIHQALYQGLSKLRKYNSLKLIFPKTNHYCTGIKDGFRNFCNAEGFQYEIRDEATSCSVNAGELYIVIEQTDLVELIKKSAAKNFKLGKHLGVIAFNHSPFMEILAGGIAVLSTDFTKMGQTLAEMIKDKAQHKVKNPFSLTIRNSI